MRKHVFIVNEKKVQRLMRELDIRVTAFTRKSCRYSSYKRSIGKVAPNLINSRFDSSIPHQKITTDRRDSSIMRQISLEIFKSKNYI